MQANYGYQDGAGTWYVTVDTDACDGCEACVDVCPSDLWVVQVDEYDPLSDEEVAVIAEDHRDDLRYDCSPCKSPEPDVADTGTAACEKACHTNAISFSW